MNRKLKLVLIFLLLATIACQKQEDATINKLLAEGGVRMYFPLAVGNYWIYDVSFIDTNGVRTFPSRDSVFVEGIQQIRGVDYFVLKSNMPGGLVQYLRDSVNFIVNEMGERIFTPDLLPWPIFEDATTNFNGDTTVYLYRQMHLPNEPTICNAGIYSTLDAELTRYLPFANTTTKAHNYYAPWIGPVLRTEFPFINGRYKEFNLLRYHVQ